MGFAADSPGSAMSADQELNLAPTFVGPHPRHRLRSLHDRWYITGTQHHHDEQFHLVDNDFDPAPHDDDPATGHNDDGPTSAGRDEPTGSSSDSLPTGDRGPRPQALRSIRYRRSGLVRRNRLAGIQLPIRRREPDGMSWSSPVGSPLTRRPVYGARVKLADLMDGSRRQPCGRCTAVCVLGLLTLAALIREVI